MVCSCVVPSKRVLLQIIFFSCGTTFWREKWLIASLRCQEVIKYENKLCDRMIKQLLNSVIAKYRNFSAIIEVGFRADMKNSTGLGECYPPRLPPRWITPSQICRILHILRTPSSIIVSYLAVVFVWCPC